MARRRKKPDPPSLWIIAGANGSGKTTAYQRLMIEAPRGSVWIIDPDELALRIATTENLAAEEANLHAVKRIEGWLYASVEAYQTVGVETVLSTDKYRKLVSFAKERGFRLRFQYVYLKTAEMNIERVKIRVAKGGHDVPENKIRDRRRRSLEQFVWFFEEADEAFVFDNSGAQPVLKIEKRERQLTIFGDLIDELAAAIDQGEGRKR